MARRTYNESTVLYSEAGEYFNGGEVHTLSVDLWSAAGQGLVEQIYFLTPITKTVNYVSPIAKILDYKSVIT